MKDLQEDNLFGSMRERLGRYEEAPSDELWGKIASQTKRERVWPLFLEPVGVIVIGVALLFGYDTKTTIITESEIVQNEVAQQQEQEFKQEQVSVSEKKKATSQKTPSTNIVSIIETQPITNNSELITEEVESPIIITKKDSSSISSPKEITPPYKKRRSKFQLYLSVTPSLSFQKMSPSGNDDVIVQGFAPRSSMSMKRFGFGVDAGFQRDINRFFGFYGGLSYYRQQQELTYQYYNKQAVVTRVGDAMTYEIFRQEHTKTFDYSMSNIGVSGGVLVTLKGEKLKHKFGAGLIYTHSLNSTNSYLAYKLSYRNEVKINDGMSWYVEPTFVYSFISKEKLEEPFTLKPYRAGISMGLLYRFRN